MIDDGNAEHALGPGDGVGIGALAGQEQRAQRAAPRYFLRKAPSGSSFRTARKAVGAVKKATTPYSAITRQKAPASGVPTGLPS